MPDVRTVLIRGLITAALGFVVSCARADATPAKVERVMAIGCRIRVTADGEAIRIEAVATSREDVNGQLSVRHSEDQRQRHQPQYSKRQLQPGSQPGRSSFDDLPGCIRCGSLPGQVGAQFKFRECLMRFALRNHFSAIAFTRSRRGDISSASFRRQCVRHAGSQGCVLRPIPDLVAGERAVAVVFRFRRHMAASPSRRRKPPCLRRAEIWPGRWRWGATTSCFRPRPARAIPPMSALSAASTTTSPCCKKGRGSFSNVSLVGVKGLTVDVLQPPGTRAGGHADRAAAERHVGHHSAERRAAGAASFVSATCSSSGDGSV